MFSFSRGTQYIDCNSRIQNSIITTTSIDMNDTVITNHGTPINPTDVVNKNYVDTLVGASANAFNITLTGTSYTLVTSILSGTIRVYIKNLVTNGPSAIFDLTKSSNTMTPSQTRITSSAGLGTLERLVMRWNPGSGLEVKKTNVNYDGLYFVRIDYI